MNIIVTGGAGFIGSHICERLLGEGHRVVCLDNFDPYYPEHEKRAHVKKALANPGYRLVEGSILDPNLLSKVMKEESIDYVFHEAAQPGVRISVENPKKAHEVNATGTLNVLEAARNTSVRKVVHASSSSVYGKMEYLPYDEKHPTNPISPYGVSKLAAEHYCRVFSELYGLKTTVLRYFTVYGPRMRPDLAIARFCKKALTNEQIDIFGDGEKTRDFTYISDAVDANILAMQKGDGGVYNVGTGSRITINQLAEKIIRFTNSSSRIAYSDSKKGDVEHTLANPAKADRELGWAPKVGIEQGLKSYVQWLKEGGK